VNRAVEEGLLNDRGRRLWVVGVGAAGVIAAPVKWADGVIAPIDGEDAEAARRGGQ
jgi:hypothetical protein